MSCARTFLRALMVGVAAAAWPALSQTALRFDGANGYVAIPYNSAFNAYPLTVSVWFRTTNSTAVNGLVGNYADSSYDGWTLVVQNGALRGFFYSLSGGGGRAIDATSAQNVADGFWHHAAMVVDGGGGRLYLDGVLIAGSSWLGWSGATTSTLPLQIGKYWTYANTFQGDIDEVRLWNRTLDATEINYLKHRQVTGTEDGLVALYHFEEGSGTTVSDSTGHGYNGAFAGGSPEWVPSRAPLVFNAVSGKALTLHGGTDGITVNHAAALDSYPITLAAWIKTSDASAVYRGVVSKYVPGSGNGYSLHLYSGHIYAHYFGASGHVYSADPGVDGGFVADGRWHHVAWVVDSIGGRLYVDGGQTASLGWTGTPSAATTTTSLLLGYFFQGSIVGQLDEVTVWSRALPGSEIQTRMNVPLVGNEAGLAGYWRLDEGSGTTAADSSGQGNTGTLVNGPTWIASTAYLGDGTSSIHSEVGTVQWTRQFAIATSPNRAGFAGNVTSWVRRLDDFGAVPASTSVGLTLQSLLQSTVLGAPIPLVNSATQASLNLSAFNAAIPQGSAGGSKLAYAINVQPSVQLDSVNDTFSLGVAETHTINGGGSVSGETLSIAAVPLLHFDGNLFFGSIATTFSSITNTPTRGALSGGGISTVLGVNNNSGTLTANPAYHYGNGAPLNATLLSNGDAIVAPGTVVSLSGGDTDCIANICYSRSSLTMSNDAFRGVLALELPAGFGVCTNFSASNHVAVGRLPLGTQPLDVNMRPVSSSFTYPGTLYSIEETKPIWIRSSGLTWTVSAGQLALQSPSAVQFVRQEDDDLLGASGAYPTNRVSNDGYFLNAGFGGGPVTVTADANGIAQLTVNVTLSPPELRPNFPYAGSDPGNQIPTTSGGQLLITNGIIDRANSYLALAGPIPVIYARDCFDTNCSETSITPATIPFSVTGNQLRFTPDGGLLGYGATTPTNLTWGYAGGDNFAQRTSDVTTGAWLMAGTFLRADQSLLDSNQWPAVLLLSGFGDASDPSYIERPGQTNYPDGLANYPGANFRAPAQGESYIAGQLSGWYPLTARSKYYARYGGVSGIHESATFPANLMLYGYALTFTSYRLSFLDSENWESRTDGAVALPNPSGFLQEFERMKFACKGALDSAQVPPFSPAKHLAYWNTDIKPQSIEFHATNDDVCGTSPRFLVMGVETKLPFIPQAFHAVLGIKNNGNLVTSADNVAGADSRFALPATLSLQGPGGSSYPLSTAGDGYFNNWETPGRPDAGFYNVVGKLRVPFFSDVKVHLHVTPTGPSTAQINVMGGWRSIDGEGKDLGWNAGNNNFFNTAKFDRHHDGWPTGISLSEYRNSSTETYRPRAQRDWIDVAHFDYPMQWNSVLREFAGFVPAKVTLPVIDVDSSLKELSPGKIDFDFAQDITLKLPRIKVLDFANDALNEVNGQINTVSNAIRQELGAALSTAGLTSGFRSLQRALQENASSFFQPVLQPALEPVANQLYTLLSEMQRTNSANLLNSTIGIVTDPNNGLKTAVQGINGAATQASSVFGQINQTLADVDDTIGLMLRVLEKDSSGHRHVVRVIIQKLVQDQGPALGFATDLTDDLVNGLLADLEPTLAKVESELIELKGKFSQLRTQIAAATGSISGALNAAVNDATALQTFADSSGGAVSNLLKSVVANTPDWFTANPDAAKAAIRERLILAFLGSPLTGNYQQTFKQFLFDDNYLLDQLMNVLFDQVNRAIRDGLSSQIVGASDGAFKALKGAGALSQALLSAKIRGAPTFQGDSLRQIHLDSDIQMNLPDEMHFTAFMDIKELTSENTPLDCIPAGAPAAEVTLGARDVPLSWAGINSSGAPLTLTVEGRWTLQSGKVLGIGGLFDIKGEAGFKGCSIKEIGATFTFGELENYFAAKAAGTILVVGIPVNVQAGIFAGHACSLDPLKFVDPESPEILGDPLGFRGLYVQFGGGLSLSDILFGGSSCLLDVRAGVTTAVYYEGGPRSGKIGFRQKDSLDIELLCLISGRADLALGASAEFSPPDHYEIDLVGSAHVCCKVGACPFCVEPCGSITVKGIVKDGGVDYFIDY